MLRNLALIQTWELLDLAKTLQIFKKGIHKPSHSVSLVHNPAHVHVFCVSMQAERYVKY